MSQTTKCAQYTAKIEHLLNIEDERLGVEVKKERTLLHGDERRLVALIMLANSNLVTLDQFKSVWFSKQRGLQVFCQRLLLLKQETTQICIDYARLIVLLIERIVSVIAETEDAAAKDNTLDDSCMCLMHQVLEFLCNSSSNEQALTVQLTTQILECTNIFFAVQHKSKGEASKGCKSLFSVERFLEPLWGSYCKGMIENSLRGDSGDESSNDMQMMESTLQAILDRFCSENNLSDNMNYMDTDSNAALKNWKQRLHLAMEEFLGNHLFGLFAESSMNDPLVQSISRWLAFCLTDLQVSARTKNSPRGSIHQLPLEYQQSWHRVLLLYVRQCAFHPCLPTMVAKLRTAVMKLILVHIVSPLGNETSENIRLLAWTTCASWVDQLQGFDWILIDDITSSDIGPVQDNNGAGSKALGSASHLCAIIRLASGEWRIQLGYRLSVRETSAVTMPRSDLQQQQQQQQQQQRAGVVQACAHLLVSAVTYLTSMAADLEHGNDGNAKDFLMPEALLHLRDSLQDALQVSSNYLSQLSKSSDPLVMDKEDILIVQVLTNFLTEFDVFDAQTNLDSDEILTALYFGLKTAGEHIDTKERLITCLIGVLESARDDSFRVLLLKEHNLLGNTVESFLCQCWENSGASLQSIPWACHLTELWYTIRTDYQSELRLHVDSSAVKRSLVERLRHLLAKASQAGGGVQLTTSLNACIGCFVTLHGDSPPTGKEALIIQRALQFCATHS